LGLTEKRKDMRMQTDRELLELAAKAAGYEPQGMEDGMLYLFGVQEGWNPLEDDGDALRLLAVLPSLWSLSMKFGPHVHLSVAWGTGAGIQQVHSIESSDVAATIRRAIVCAAADIGARL
jgi:hypothetical protein